MSTWPTSWREMALDRIGVEVTAHALNVLRDWHLSTPTEPWTNNPLGLPAMGNDVPQAMGTPYGAFPTHRSFREALVRVADAGGSMPLRHALHEDTSIARAWRTINSLNLPGNDTETDYPALLLDRADESYRSKAMTAIATDRKSMGRGMPADDGSHYVAKAVDGILKSTVNMHDLDRAIGYLKGWLT